tara:strand:+ start:232 stop:813 length:582 start_codon:yes stop_codon:yes gene_type:complete
MVAIGSKICFIHIPRTAGTYVADVLEKAGYVKNLPGDTHNVPTKYKIRDRKPVTILREPMDWLNSYLKFIHYGGRCCLPFIDSLFDELVDNANYSVVMPRVVHELSLADSIIDRSLSKFILPGMIVIDFNRLCEGLAHLLFLTSCDGDVLSVQQLKTSRVDFFSQEIQDNFRRNNPFIFEIYDRVKEKGYLEL